jgi:hypothetical protein
MILEAFAAKGREKCFWAGLLIAIAMFNIQSGRSDLKSVVGVFLLPEDFIVQTHSKMESALDGFELGYFFGSKGATKGNSKRRGLTGVYRDFSSSLMNRVRSERCEWNIQKFQPCFGQHFISGYAARINEFDINSNFSTFDHIHKWASSRADHQARAQAFRPQFNSIVHSFGRSGRLAGLVDNRAESKYRGNEQPPFGLFEGCVPMWRVIVGFLICVSSGYLLFFNHDRDWLFWLGIGLFLLGSFIWLGGNEACQDADADNGGVHIEMSEYTLLNQGLPSETQSQFLA